MNPLLDDERPAAFRFAISMDAAKRWAIEAVENRDAELAFVRGIVG
jgi:hypothetical protein